MRIGYFTAASPISSSRPAKNSFMAVLPIINSPPAPDFALDAALEHVPDAQGMPVSPALS